MCAPMLSLALCLLLAGCGLASERVMSLHVGVSSCGTTVQHDPLKVNLEGALAFTEPVKLSVQYRTPLCNNTETALVDVEVMVPLGVGTRAAAGKVARPAPTCWKGYGIVNGISCYRQNVKYVNWVTCKQLCEDDGARMAIPNSAHKMDELMTFLKIDSASNDKTPFWVGIHKYKNLWETIEGVPIDDDAWALDEPKGSGDCSYASASALYDHPCDWAQSCVCEQHP